MLNLDYVLDAIAEFQSDSFEEFARGARRGGGRGGKKNCKKQQCGASCIAMDKICRQNMSPTAQEAAKSTRSKSGKSKKTTGGGGAADDQGQQQATPTATTPEVKSKKVDLKKISPANLDSFDQEIKKEFDLDGGNKGSISFYKSDPGNWSYNIGLGQIKVYSVDFKINDSFDSGSFGDSKSGVKAALSIRKELNNVFSKLPDGTIVHNDVYMRDGKGKGRAALYEKFGFGKVKRTGRGADATNDQYGIVVGGKVLPLTEKQVATLAEKSYLKSQQELLNSLL